MSRTGLQNIPPKLERTKKYDLFEFHETNRDESEKPKLLASMTKYGFMPSGAIHCTRLPNGKLKIVRGHHRFRIARRLGLEVWYIVDESNTNIFELEGDSTQAWRDRDFVSSYARQGNPDYIALKQFQEEHQLPLGAAASLVAGESASSNNQKTHVREGTFKQGDMAHAYDVVAVTDTCRLLCLPFATKGGFVSAVSAALRVPEISMDLLVKRLKSHGMMMRNCSTRDAWLAELDSLYNYGAHSHNRVPLRFRAIEIGRERQKTFGGKRGAPSHRKPPAHVH